MPAWEGYDGSGKHGIYSGPDSDETSPTVRSRIKQRTRRASRACLSCRARKVRCDLVSRFPKSCTNCHLDRTECITPDPRKKNKAQAPLGRNAISLDTELPPLLSPDSSATPNTGFLDDPGLNLAHVLVQDGPLSSISNTIRYSFPPETVGGATRPALDCIIGACAQDSIMSTNDFEDDNAFFADFVFTETLSDQSHSQTQPILHSSGRPTAPPRLHTPEPQSSRAHSKHCSYVSPLSWVADWGGQPLLQPEPPKTMGTSLAPEVVESLLRDYFQFVNPTFPVVSEWDVYRMTHPKEIQATEKLPLMSLAFFNAIMFAASAFATADVAQAAGFPNIRAMREAFHTRAQALYEAGCERDLSNQIRICLLLSQRRKYPGGMFENEQWTVRAQHLLQQAEKPPLVSQTPPRRGNSSRWKILSCCCIIRAQRVLIGTHRNASIATVSQEVPSITEADLEEDLEFPWFLDVATKRELAQVFVAIVDLHRVMDPLCQVVLRNEPSIEPGEKGLSRTIPFRRSIMGPLEEVESSLMEWRTHYDELFPVKWETTRNLDAASPSCLTMALAFVNLTYEYCVSQVHQISLDSERSSTTSWAAKMRESSREALQVSAASTTRIFRDLITHDAVKLLPLSAITMVFIPLTINNIFLKSSMQGNTRSVYDLSICFQALETLTERHEIADFFWELNKASVMLAHKNLAKSSVSGTPRMVADNLQDKNISPCDDQDKVPLPSTDTYSSILKLLKRSFAVGTVQWDLVMA